MSDQELKEIFQEASESDGKIDFNKFCKIMKESDKAVSFDECIKEEDEEED